jgi:enoyl-CoA hydratase
MNHIRTEIRDDILLVTLSRPQALNALNMALLEELKMVVDRAYDDREIKAMILTGEGEKAFVAGADIKELISLNEEEALQLSTRGQQLFKRIENCPKPVIAAINGFTLGGGCELAMSCHLRLATENSKFGQPEVNLGIIPGYGATQRLTQMIGRGKALELMLTGDMIGAEEAKTLGLINHVVKTKEDLMTLAFQIAEKITRKGPIAVSLVISSVNSGFSFEDAGYQAEARHFASCTKTQDFREGTSAFIEKRQPQFKGA